MRHLTKDQYWVLFWVILLLLTGFGVKIWRLRSQATNGQGTRPAQANTLSQQNP